MVNRRTVEALIRAGSFDSLDPDRHKMLASVGIALEAAEQVQRDALQAGLFDAGPASVETAVDFVSVPPWDERERLMGGAPRE